jgi:hypothetical protein
MNKGIIFLFVILLLAIVGGAYGLASLTKEGYSNFSLGEAGSFPSNVDSAGLLYDEYPSTGRKTVSNNSYADIWWYYPVFGVGSYAQITNNLRYRRNPDDGVCTTAEFCGALYKDNQIASNIITPLPPVPDTPGTRVNYYRTPENLFLGPQPGPALELPAF